MAVQADYNFKGVDVKGVYLRIDRVYGSKKEGWNAVVSVYANEKKANPVQPTPIIDENGVAHPSDTMKECRTHDDPPGRVRNEM